MTGKLVSFVQLSLSVVLSLSLFAFSASAVTTTIYVSPSADSLSEPVSIDAVEANQILSHHFGLFQQSGSASRAHIWDHVVKLDDHQGQLELDQKALVEQLFEPVYDEQNYDNKNRLLVLIHGPVEIYMVPDHIRPTHVIESSPSKLSLDALMHSYMSTIFTTLPISSSAYNHLATNMLDEARAITDRVKAAFEGVARWFTQSSADLKTWTSSWFNDLSLLLQKHSQSESLQSVFEELRAVSLLIAKIQDSDTNGADLTFQPVRLEGLNAVKQEFGEHSTVFTQAREMVRAALGELTDVFNQRSESQGRQASLAFVLNDQAADSQMIKRQGLPSLMSPFVKRDVEAVSSRSAKKQPKLDLLASCFKSQHELEQATDNCSGHGKGRQSSQGGHSCWRCQCQPTKGKGKTTYWAGSACEKKDVSSEFILIGSTVLVLAFVSLTSVYFLYYQGNVELPGILAGVTINLK